MPYDTKMKIKVFLLVFGLFLLPCVSLAADLNKGLLDPANWGEQQKFLTGGANLAINPPEVYPTPLFMIDAGKGIIFHLSADKEKYQAGNEVKMTIEAKSQKYQKTLEGMSQPIELFYLWTKGNFNFEVYRISDDVKNGEFLVASGKAYPDDQITMLQGEQRRFSINFQLPENAVSGTYEVRVYPSSGMMLFRGSPEDYHSLLKTRFEVTNDKTREEQNKWELDKIVLNGQSVHLKSGVLRIGNNTDSVLSIPLLNQGPDEEHLALQKRIIVFFPEYGSAVSEEREDITLKSGETKTVELNLNDANIKGKSTFLVQFNFADIGKGQSLREQNYFGYPLNSSGGESVVVPIFVKGNVNPFIIGMGILTTKDSPGFSQGSFATPFLEIWRTDPLFYESAETKRGTEDNLKLDLALFDRAGNKIDEIGYAGPSWDRTGQIWKTVQLKKDYDYLKLVGVLDSQSQGEIERKEMEYYYPIPPRSWIERFKKTVENNWEVWLVGTTLTIAILAIMMLVLVIKRKNKLKP
jgi:hypothetical protein